VTIVGTWYSRDSRGPGTGLSAGELVEMLDAVNASYGGWRFQPEDVRAVHVGFLPAIPASVAGDGEPVPMDKPMCEPATTGGGPAGLWYLQTEKWTTVRRLAQHFIDRLAAEDSLSATVSRTATLALPGGEPDGLSAAREALAKTGLPGQVTQRLESAYGSRATELLELFASNAAAGEAIPGSDGVMAAEIFYAIEREHARTLGDLLRRTGIGSAGRPAAETLATMTELAAGPLAWDSAEQERQVAAVLAWPQFRTEAYADAH
jgi:glycerol-3-phosphate dehydrogenase